MLTNAMVGSEMMRGISHASRIRIVAHPESKRTNEADTRTPEANHSIMYQTSLPPPVGSIRVRLAEGRHNINLLIRVNCSVLRD